MLRHSSIDKGLLALLLSVSFVWSWAVCTSWCDEITAQSHNGVNAPVEQNRENALNLTGQTDGCPLTATAAILQQRPAVQVSATITAAVSAFLFGVPPSAWSVLPPQSKRNLPPELSLTPLLAQLCALRI